MDELYVVARRVLLDALEALGPHREALVLVGAQAIYLRIGEADLAVAPYTTDGDLAIDPAVLGEVPPLEQALRLRGFQPKSGVWLILGIGGYLLSRQLVVAPEVEFHSFRADFDRVLLVEHFEDRVVDVGLGPDEPGEWAGHITGTNAGRVVDRIDARGDALDGTIDVADREFGSTRFLFIGNERRLRRLSSPPPPNGYRSLRNSSIVSPASRTIPPIV